MAEQGAGRGTGDPLDFRDLADALGLGMAFQMRVGADGASRAFTYLSESCERLTGVPPAAALRDPDLLYRQILPEHQATMAAAEAEALAREAPFAVEVPMRGPAGDVRWRRIVSRPRPSPDGGSLWDGLMMDVTDARLAADAAEAQRLRLETAVSATGLGLWEWDPRRNRVTWSARTCELFDVPPPGPKHIYGAVELVFPADRQAMRDAYAAAAAAPDGGDFVVEHRTSRAPADQPRWLQTSGRVIKDADGVRQVIGASLDITDRVASEERRGLLMRELAHRAKNGIAVMMALVAQASRNAHTVAEFENVLSTRLRAMAESQDLVTAANGGAVALADVIAKTVGPFDASRFDIDASLAEVTVPGDMAIGLGLLLHELSTNAVKYGALSSVSGRVTIRRSPGAPGETRLTWAERGGPEVRPTRRRGFGSRLLEMVLRTQGGRVDPLFAPEGFRADIRFPQAAADRLH